MSKYEPLWDYVSKSSESTLLLDYDTIQKILGFPIDHSFLNAKKELIGYGWCVTKISMKNQTVRFDRI